ncbi:MAG: hypothetical protein IKI81_03530 [Selenomonadaceae bacterium]|nr:hypothetical protein [Selenomonadaceae bacterium]
MSKWDRLGWLAGGALLGSYGLKILFSKDAKKVYTHCTAAAFRMKDEVMRNVTAIRENAEDISAAAKDINEQRAREEEERIIEDAKAVLANAEAGDIEGARRASANAEAAEE